MTHELEQRGRMIVYENFPAAGVKCCLRKLQSLFGNLSQLDFAEEQGWHLKSLNEVWS